LHGGYLSDALVDLTGGVQVQFSLKDPPPYLEEILKAADTSQCLMGCSTSGQVSHRARSMPFWVYHVCVRVALLSEKGSPKSLCVIVTAYGCLERSRQQKVYKVMQ